MKNILTIFLTFVITITLFSGCANNRVDNENNTETSSSEKSETTTQGPLETTIQTTVETTVSNNAADYLPTAYEAMLLLKDYFTQQGYDFDSWTVQNSAEKNYQMLNTSGNIGAIIINNGQLTFTIDANNQILYSTPECSVTKTTVIKINSYNCYEALDILFSNCPDNLKPPTDELKNMADSIVPPGQKDTEKTGIEYSVVVGNNNIPVIMFNPS